ncbi:MAG: hypothetical protein KF764_02985 [Labilithrix sp.]|nr:hypothetical protein [Labilithrix sp.]
MSTEPKKPEVMCTLTVSEFGKPDTTYTFTRCRMGVSPSTPSDGESFGATFDRLRMRMTPL